MNWQEVKDREAVYRMNGETFYLKRKLGTIGISEDEYERQQAVLEFERTIRAINTDENGKVWKPDLLTLNNPNSKPSYKVVVYPVRAHDGIIELHSFIISTDVEITDHNCWFQTKEKAEHAWKYFKPLFEKYYLNR